MRTHSIPLLRRFFPALLVLLATSLPAQSVHAGPLNEITELLAHPEQYDKQAVSVVGRVDNLQIATNRQGQLAYGFLLKDGVNTVKVIGLGKAEIHEGDQVIVEGIFNRLRQVGRAVVYNEIKVTVIRPLNQLNPDLVG